MTKAKVAILRTKPSTVLKDYEKLMGLADFQKELLKDTEVILKDNISWHYPMPSANTTPWQLEGVIKALKNAGYKIIEARDEVKNPSKYATGPHWHVVIGK